MSRARELACRVWLLAFAVLAGCVANEPTTTLPAPAPARDIGILVFGDHGYQLDYLEAEDYEPPRTREQFIAAERRDWREDKRPPEEFRPPAMTRYRNGSWVAASGMLPVAKAMHDWCRASRCDLAAMLGDNVYPNGATLGTDGNDDATRFEKLLREPFGPFADLGADFRIYAALGNHDWKTSRGGAMAQVDYLARTAPFYMDGIIYKVRPPAAEGAVELFVIDTTVLLAGQTVYEDTLSDDARELRPTQREDPDRWVRPTTRAEREMVPWLERSLAASNARWKIVIGHHPLWSSAGSKYEQARVLRRLILPALCRYADAYLAGHDHTLELHYDDCSEALPRATVPPFPAVVSGAAGKQRGLNSAFMRHQRERYPELTTEWALGMVWGFAHLTVRGDEATLRFVTTPDDGSGTGELAHTARFTRRSGTSAGR